MKNVLVYYLLAFVFCFSGVLSCMEKEKRSPQVPNREDISRSLNRFLSAVARGDVNGVRQLIRLSSTPINATDEHGWTALMIAAQNGYKEIVKLLIDAKVDIHSKNSNGCTALTLAAGKGSAGEVYRKFMSSKDIIALLLDAGARVNDQENTGKTALHWAAYNGDKEVIEMLIAHGAHVNATCKYLLPHSNQYYVEDFNNYTPLLFAAEYGHAEATSALLYAGADINAATQDGRTALILASHYGHSNVVQVLLKKGADVNTKTTAKCTALYFAVVKGHKEIVRMLIDAGIEVNDPENKTTLVRDAVLQGSKEIILLLLDAGADVNAQFEDGHTALIAAVSKLESDLIALLLERGAQITITPQQACIFTQAVITLFQKGILPAQLVHELVKQNYTGMLTALIKAGFRGNIKDQDGITPLMVAAREGNKNIVEMLIAHSADVNEESNNGNTPLIRALYRGHADIAKILLSAGAKTKSSKKDAFLIVAQKGAVALMDLLLQAGAQDTYGYTILSYPLNIDKKECHVCQSKHIQLCNCCRAVRYCSKECQMREWKIHKPFCFKKYLLDKLVQRQNQEISLQQEDTDYQDSQGHTVLMDAAQKGHTGLVQKLLEVKANTSLTNKQGKTALMLAQEAGHQEIVQLLQDK